MAVRRLNVPLILEADERAADGMGGHRVTWRALGILHAALDAGAGRMLGGEAGRQGVAPWRITLRAFAPGDPRRPAPGQRLRMGARIFRIHAVAEADPAGRYLSVTAMED
ncbi:MAG: head-tail adaptor protein [Paracoccus sp. (in: a-proteobacteria)]|nr:head-tail adaptor protein [Paracoccus sp. (in: a-proteobacteria)]